VPDDARWIKDRITAAGKDCDSLTEAACDGMEKLLNGPLSERPQSASELRRVAKVLLAAMVPTYGEARK
jgi:hypothetical protein